MIPISELFSFTCSPCLKLLFHRHETGVSWAGNYCFTYMKLLFRKESKNIIHKSILVLNIIYQTNLSAIYGNTSHGISRIGPVPDGFHRVAIYNLIVFHPHDRIGIYRIDNIIYHLLHTLFGRKVSTFF